MGEGQNSKAIPNLKIMNIREITCPTRESIQLYNQRERPKNDDYDKKINYETLNKACPKDSFHLPNWWTQQLVTKECPS